MMNGKVYFYALQACRHTNALYCVKKCFLKANCIASFWQRIWKTLFCCSLNFQKILTVVFKINEEFCQILWHLPESKEKHKLVTNFLLIIKKKENLKKLSKY